MSLGEEVGLGPGHIVLDADPAFPTPKGAQKSSNFQPMSIVAKRMDYSIKMQLGTKVGLGSGHIMSDGDLASPQKKGGTALTFWRMSIAVSYTHLTLPTILRV